MPTDVNDDASDQSDASASTSKSRSSQSNDAERQRGLNRTIDKLKRENAVLQAKVDDLAASQEEEKSALRVQIAEHQKQLKALQNERDLEKANREKAETEANRLKLAKDADKLIAEKFPGLLPDHLLGDLKTRPDFADDAAYEAYLDRLSKRLGGATSGSTPENADDKKGETATGSTSLRDKVAGATPNGGGRVADANMGYSTEAEIMDAFGRLNPKDPNYDKEFNKLLEAQNKFLH